jgi:hypothetical protein
MTSLIRLSLGAVQPAREPLPNSGGLTRWVDGRQRTSLAWSAFLGQVDPAQERLLTGCSQQIVLDDAASVLLGVSKVGGVGRVRR